MEQKQDKVLSGLYVFVCMCVGGGVCTRVWVCVTRECAFVFAYLCMYAQGSHMCFAFVNVRVYPCVCVFGGAGGVCSSVSHVSMRV